MHIPSSLLALLALTPSIAIASPVAQLVEESTQVTGPSPTPDSDPTPISQPQPTSTLDFSRCVFPAVIRTSINGPFKLNALSDTLPFSLYWVLLRDGSADGALEPYITVGRPAPPQFTLNEGSLNTTLGFDGASSPGRFSPSDDTKVLERLLFGGSDSASGSEEPAEFYSIQSCDASGRPYQELKAGRRGTFFFFCLYP